MNICKSVGCSEFTIPDTDFCTICTPHQTDNPPKLSELYPKYYKCVRDYEEIDVYAVHSLFDIQDSSGALQHASKKLLLSGVRTGGKTREKDIREARDTLTRWLELHDTVN